MSSLPGWEWQSGLEHRRWIEEYDRAVAARDRRQPHTYTQTQLQQQRHQEEQHMKVSEAFSGNMLKAAELRGKHVLVTINRVSLEKLGDDSKWCLFFVGKEKGLVLNKTNATTIADSLGEEMDNWIGRTIELRSERVMFKGDMVDGLRVSVPLEQGPAQTAPAQPAAAPARPHQGVPESDFDDSIPF